MALICCPECKADVSDQAKTCPKCGAKLKGSLLKWFFIVPAILVIAFLIYGALIPENVAKANAAWNLCRDMYTKGQVLTMGECDKMKDKILRGEKS